MNNHVSPNRYQVLTDVAENNNNVDVTIDKEIMNEQELYRLNKKSNCKTDKREVSNLKKIVILGDSIVKLVNGWQLPKSLKNEKAFVLSFSGASSKQMM